MSVEILDLAALALTAVFFALLYYLQESCPIHVGRMLLFRESCSIAGWLPHLSP